ncbi:RluA family pseudouridine synthase [Cypionkella sp.]|uniref:RluA family pseudouridine synthase n=1 Tax=Cypionkella sp. TaxID=2811411 RepID=UPI002AB7F44C|nr:pseudouridine synthase [Cypionkella sp.]MDZ4394429.1 pseudouridine synthase [Cypionkella sp.]
MIPDFIYNPPDVPLDILYQDAQIIVVNKPAGLLSVPGKLEGREDCLVSRLQAAHWDTLLVHRLDCDTSGVMIFARTKQAQGFLGQEFEKRRAKKTYIAEVYGALTPDQGHIDLPLCADWPNRPRQMVDHTHGRPAQTDWHVISRGPETTRVRLFPLTGRSHQLRVHMLAQGCPILGDPIYASGKARDFPRLMLHAESLSLHHPASGDWVTFTAPVPF